MQKLAETWKPIIGFEDSYEISNYGNVKSIDRIVPTTNRHKKEHIMKPSVKKGYLVIRLQYLGKNKYSLIHRLVAEHFLIKQYENHEVNHIDGNKKNNYVNNLEWVSRSDNHIHAHQLGLKKSNLGEKSNLTKLKTEEVLIIRELCNKGEYYNTIAKKFNISISQVKRIHKRINWKHL